MTLIISQMKNMGVAAVELVHLAQMMEQPDRELPDMEHLADIVVDIVDCIVVVVEVECQQR
ncbi:hypothetical protein BLOT_010927 [Blomia tropicalis]|nr:hypothetical protein BLOT_010927 [Blomia tropicalis]